VISFAGVPSNLMSRPFRKRMISAILLFVGYLLIDYVKIHS